MTTYLLYGRSGQEIKYVAYSSPPARLGEVLNEPDGYRGVDAVHVGGVRRILKIVKNKVIAI